MISSLKNKSVSFIIGQILNSLLIVAMIYFIISTILDKSLAVIPLVFIFTLLLIAAGFLQIKGNFASIIIYLVLFILTIIPAITFWQGLSGLFFPAYIFLTLIFFSVDYFKTGKRRI